MEEKVAEKYDLHFKVKVHTLKAARQAADFELRKFLELDVDDSLEEYRFAYEVEAVIYGTSSGNVSMWEVTVWVDWRK